MKDKFYEVAEYTYKHIPMYKGLAKKATVDAYKAILDKNKKDIPLTSKSTYLLADEQCYTDEYCENYGKDIIKTSSSGSTGKCLTVYHTADEIAKSLFSLWLYRKKWYGISTSDKVCTFYSDRLEADLVKDGIFFRKNDETTLGIYKNNIDKNRLLTVYLMIQEFKPVWMILQPSIATLLCEFVIEKNLKPIENLRYIELTGEILPRYTKNLIENVFKCTVANQYGCEEANSIAYECPNGHLHCLSSNVYVEILDDCTYNEVADNAEGEIYITSLVNRFMPFIRYQVGDRGRFREDIECEYSKAGKILELTNARSCDWAFLKNGKKISSYVFYETVEKMNKVCNGVIMQFQVEQLTYEKFEIALALDVRIIKESAEAFDAFAAAFLEQMPKVFPEECEFSFTFYKNLFPDSSTGKLKYFTSRVDYES